MGKGKGLNLASMGDLLTSIGALEDVHVGKSVGLGAGLPEIKKIFSGDTITIENPTSKVNFLVDEYSEVLSQVQLRWQMGIGRYLLSKVEGAMQKNGILEVDHVEGKAGNFVFINGHAVGLSSKLTDFEELAVRMPVYQEVLTSLTAKIPRPIPAQPKEQIYVPSPI